MAVRTLCSRWPLLVCTLCFSVAEPDTNDSFGASSNAGADWWVESSLARVMPFTTQPRTSAGRKTSACVHMAGNEHESFQVALRATVNRTYTISWDPFDGPGDDSSVRLSWEQVGLVYVYEMMDNTDGPAGWWPDPTLRVPKAFGVKESTTSVWFTAFASAIAVAGEYKTTITLQPDVGKAIQVPLSVTVFGFTLPTAPALQTAFNLQESSLAGIYDPNGPPPTQKWNVSTVQKMWAATGCSNPFSATRGEQPMWESSRDAGAADMYAYCKLTKAGTATKGQLAVCGSVKGNCTLQHPPGHAPADDPKLRPGHAEYVKWAKWLLANYSLNPGTIYAPPIPFTVDELLEFVPLGLNHFTAFPAHSEYATDPNVAEYVKTLDSHNLSQFATTYGYDESDELDDMQSTFGKLKAAYPTVKTFTTAHMCGTPGDLSKPMVPCYGTCPGPMCRNGSNGVPIQDPVQIKGRNIDYMCPILDWIKPDNVSACEKAGLDMWMYTSLEPWKNYTNILFHNALYEPRLLFWQIFQLRLTGFLYYDLCAWENKTLTHKLIDGTQLTSPYIDPMEWNPMQQHGGRDVGDGKLMYGGSDGPIASIRLHAIRDGIEDFGYLQLLKEKHGDAAAQAFVAKLTTPGQLQSHIGGSVPELHKMMETRVALAEAIEGSDAIKFSPVSVEC